MIDFSDDAGKKSDYNKFAHNIDLMLNKKYSFKRIQDELFEPSLAVQVDDCSIINIRKTI